MNHLTDAMSRDWGVSPMQAQLRFLTEALIVLILTGLWEPNQ
ncbi:hypothetical protein ABZ215_25120 [Amycolatopsis sp. NPDC006131]